MDLLAGSDLFELWICRGKYLLGQLGTDLKGQAKFDLFCCEDQICLNLGFVAVVGKSGALLTQVGKINIRSSSTLLL